MTNEELRAELAKAGLRAVPQDHWTEIEMLSKRLDLLTTEAKDSVAWSRATKGAIDDLRDVVKPLLDEIRKELASIRTRVNQHEQVLAEHDAKHEQHDKRITGAFERLKVIEEQVIPKPTRRSRSK